MHSICSSTLALQAELKAQSMPAVSYMDFLIQACQERQYLTRTQISGATKWWKQFKDDLWKSTNFGTVFSQASWASVVLGLLFPGLTGILPTAMLSFIFCSAYFQIPCVPQDLKFGYWLALSLTILFYLSEILTSLRPASRVAPS